MSRSRLPGVILLTEPRSAYARLPFVAISLREMKHCRIFTDAEGVTEISRAVEDRRSEGVPRHSDPDGVAVADPFMGLRQFRPALSARVDRPHGLNAQPRSRGLLFIGLSRQQFSISPCYNPRMPAPPRRRWLRYWHCARLAVFLPMCVALALFTERARVYVPISTVPLAGAVATTAERPELLVRFDLLLWDLGLKTQLPYDCLILLIQETIEPVSGNFESYEESPK